MGTVTVLCLVLFSVLVDSVRVPTTWNEQQRNFGRWGSNHRFETWEPQQTIQRRMIIEPDESKFLLPLSAYEPKQANPVDNMFIEPKPLQTMVLSQNGLYIMPQDTQETLPIIKQESNLPPLLNPRYSEQIQEQPGQDQTWSSDITRINQATSAMLGIPSVDKYKQFKEAQLRREMLRRLAQNSRFLKDTNHLVPKKDSYNSIVRIKPQNHPNHKHIVVASEEGATLNPLGFLQQKQDLELMTKKEPVVFVTEGYRNVLVQGPNKKKKYAGAQLQSKEESRRVLNKQILGDDVDAEKPARKRKVTKVYRIHGNEGKENTGGTSRNLVQSPWKKPRKYFERPEDDRRSGLRNHLIKNYRDDSLYEPEHDRDNEREDDEKERIVEDENGLRNHLIENYRDDALHEPENDKDNEKDDDEEAKIVEDKKSDKVNENDEEASKNDEKLETDNKEVNNDEPPKNTAEPANEEEDEEEEEDDEDESESEGENQEQQQVPHSEHADPNPVPTKPIYPGVGQWAKPGLKHRPYIPQHRFVKPFEGEQQQPEGYDVFKNLEQYFENQRENFDGTFGEKVASPVTTAPSFFDYLPAIKPPNPIVVYDPFNESSKQSSQQTLNVKNDEVIPVKEDTDEATADTNRAAAEVEENNETAESEDDDSDEKEETEENNEEEEEEESDDEQTDDFVPIRLYSQVRKSENEEHEPYDPLEHGRLREVIKDSKIQTVYTEEGYEDAAYDHAGHEKKAEEAQGNAEFEREKLEPKDAKQKNSDSDSGHSNKVAISDNPSEPLIDSVASDSIYPTQPSEPSTQSPKAGQTNNFITTQQVKTTQVKDKNNGDVQLEIQSEVKVIVQPNNSTKAHKYIKIYPKVLRDIVKEPSKSEEVGNSTNIAHDINNLAISEPSSTTESSTVSIIESMTSSEKPKVVVKVLGDDGALKKINDQFSEIGGPLNNRQKRSSESAFEDVEIDTGFIDKINHTFTPPKPEIDVEKYPYYVLPDLNENSPLRYAENLNNIPVKRAGELSFYKQADKLACPDIPRNIDPIPDHVKNAHLNPEEDEESDEEDEDDEESDEEDEEESVVDKKHPATPKTPRIQLGDTIDCLKIRYFGDNPLDSPFFKEETVGPVKSIFKELDRKASQGKSASELSEAFDKINGANEILNNKNDRKFESEVKDKIFNTLNESAQKFDDVNKQQSNAKTIDSENAQSITTNTRVPKPSQLDNSVAPIKRPSTPSPLVTLITTPKYTIQLKPKNIYDQIKLLDHLPEEYDDDIEETEVTTKPLEKTTVNSERQPKLLLHEREKNQKGDDSASLQAEALRRRRISRRPGYQIFDVNKYLITTPLSVINSAPSTVLPKHKVISEVFYKDEIKPNEQLTVFADVLNNIKNSSNGESIPVQSASNFAEPSGVTVSSLDEARIQSPPNNVRVKKFQIDSSNQKNSFDDDRIAPIRRPSYNIQNNYYHHPNSNQKIGHKSAPIQVTAIPKQIDEPASSTSRTRKILKRRRKPTTTTTSTTARTTTNIRISNQNTPSNHQPYVIDFIEDSEEVVGLVPPQNFQYRTIVDDTTDSEFKDTNDVPEKVYEVPIKAPNPTTDQVSNVHPAPVTETTNEVPPTRSMNKYYFLGLKPPVHQRARPYSEFTNNNIQINDNLLLRRVAHIGLSRTKRSATRPAYADLSRNRGRQNEGLEKASTTVDDVDDYVPHRPKNYHYDEKTGKIVYHTTPSRSKPDDEEDEEAEYEEIEVPDTRGIYLKRAEDATHPTPEKVTTKRLLATAAPPAEGQGLLDFVAKLKNNPSYVYIPDPTTPKPGSKPSTTEGFVTPDPKSTDPPEFLSILSKVKTDKNYKYIEDPKEAQNKAKKKTTTPEPESDEYVDADDDEDGESLPEHVQPEPVQNSPGAQGQDLSKNLQIFDIGDYLPKVKTVTPQTTIDYSKYKTIERPHTKQNVEEEESPKKEEVVSRPPPYQYNPRGQPAIEETPIVRKPVILEERESIDTPVVSEEKIGHHKYEEALPSTTQRIVQLRRGTRPSTQSTETTEPTTRRSANRRRPVPTSIRGTRRPTTEVTEPTEKVERVYPEYYSTERAYSDSHPQSKRVYRRRPVRIRHTTERHEEDDETIDKIVRRSLEAKMKDIKNDFEKEALEDSNVEDSYEEIKDEITNDEATEEDKEDETSSETEKKEVLSSNTNSKEAYDDIKEDILYDDDEESDIADETSEGSNKTETVDKNIKDVEIINKDYNKTQKHGGNYREENDEKSEEQSEDKTIQEQTDSASNEELEKRSLKQDNKEEATINQNKPNKDVEIINKNYDRSLKHGGNYRKMPGSDEEPAEDETKQEDGSREKLIIEPKKSSDVVIIDNQYDKTKKHGGNYKSEEDAVTDELLESKQNPEETQQQIQKVAVRNERNKKPVDAKTENKLKRKIKPTTTERSNAVPRLSDVVPKPDHFYTDPNLPRQINKLGTEKLPVNLASEELAEVAAEGDILIEDSPKPQTQRISLRRRTFDKDNDEEDEAAAKFVSTKKPLYVKDPSKRLYYYVPA